MVKNVSQISTFQEIAWDFSLHFVKGNVNSVSDAEISFRKIFKHFLEHLIIISLIVLLHCLDEMSSKVLSYAFVHAVNV